MSVRIKHPLLILLTSASGVLAAMMAGMVGGWLLYSRFKIPHSFPLPPIVQGQEECLRLNYEKIHRPHGPPQDEGCEGTGAGFFQSE